MKVNPNKIFLTKCRRVRTFVLLVQLCSSLCARRIVRQRQRENPAYISVRVSLWRRIRELDVCRNGERNRMREMVRGRGTDHVQSRRS